MKILLDTCVWGGAKVELADQGYDVIWVGDWSEDPGDDEILRLAFQEGRIVVTLDKDFGELAIIRRIPHAGIIRLVNISARKQAAICHNVIRSHSEDLRKGAIISAGPFRLRIHFPPD